MELKIKKVTLENVIEIVGVIDPYVMEKVTMLSELQNELEEMDSEYTYEWTTLAETKAINHFGLEDK